MCRWDGGIHSDGSTRAPLLLLLTSENMTRASDAPPLTANQSESPPTKGGFVFFLQVFFVCSSGSLLSPSVSCMAHSVSLVSATFLSLKILIHPSLWASRRTLSFLFPFLTIDFLSEFIKYPSDSCLRRSQCGRRANARVAHLRPCVCLFGFWGLVRVGPQLSRVSPRSWAPIPKGGPIRMAHCVGPEHHSRHAVPKMNIVAQATSVHSLEMRCAWDRPQRYTTGVTGTHTRRKMVCTWQVSSHASLRLESLDTDNAAEHTKKDNRTAGKNDGTRETTRADSPSKQTSEHTCDNPSAPT